jgi:hypothetical protein
MTPCYTVDSNLHGPRRLRYSADLLYQV